MKGSERSSSRTRPVMASTSQHIKRFLLVWVAGKLETAPVCCRRVQVDFSSVLLCAIFLSELMFLSQRGQHDRFLKCV